MGGEAGRSEDATAEKAVPSIYYKWGVFHEISGLQALDRCRIATKRA
jgi:hypothetical protein